MKTILLGISIILFGISITMVSSSGLTLGLGISFGGLLLSLTGYLKEDSK